MLRSSLGGAALKPHTPPATRDLLYRIREAMDAVFAADTARGPWSPETPSRGHCVPAAYYLHRRFGGEYWSVSLLTGESHWYNRLQVDGVPVFVDLTGDPFGYLPVQCPVHTDYFRLHSSRQRSQSEITAGDLVRCQLFLSRMPK